MRVNSSVDLPYAAATAGRSLPSRATASAPEAVVPMGKVATSSPTAPAAGAGSGGGGGGEVTGGTNVLDAISSWGDSGPDVGASSGRKPPAAAAAAGSAACAPGALSGCPRLALDSVTNTRIHIKGW